MCKDIYGKSHDNKLGVTLYLEDMDRKAYQGVYEVSDRTAEYNRLKNIRNELAHSRNSFSADICSQEDIDFVRSFHRRISKEKVYLKIFRHSSTFHYVKISKC